MVGVRSVGRRGVPGALLRGDDFRHAVRSRRRLTSADGRSPGVVVVRVAGEERRHGAKVRRVVSRQALDTGKASDIDGN